LSALLGQALDAKTAAGSARFRLALGRLHACALRFGSIEANLRLCAVIEGGGLFARGVDARNARGYTMPWLAAGLGGIAGWRMSPRWAIDLSGGVRGLLVRDELVFAPGTRVHQPSIFAWDFRLGLVYRFW
jgi:hypothetical protein